MFLNILSAQTKPLVMTLLIEMAKSDGEIDASEHALLHVYANEMGLTLSPKLIDLEHDVEEAIQALSNEVIEHRRAIYLELYALMHADGKTDVKEETFLKNMRLKLGISQAFHDEGLSWYEQLLPLYQKGFQLLTMEEVNNESI